MRRRRVIIFFILCIPVFAIALYCAAQITIGRATNNIVDANDAPLSQIIIVLGASVLPNGTPSDVLRDRLFTAEELYIAGKAPKILVSGDNGGVDGYDEVNAMRKFLLADDIPADDIFLDHAGFDTYDTMYRARHVFGVTSAIVATQAFHLPRALYIGEQLGMDVVGVAAERQAYVKGDLFEMRERFANVKAFWDVTFGALPTYEGEIVDITGSGTVTWDEDVPVTIR